MREVRICKNVWTASVLRFTRRSERSGRAEQSQYHSIHNMEHAKGRTYVHGELRITRRARSQRAATRYGSRRRRGAVQPQLSSTLVYHKISRCALGTTPSEKCRTYRA